MVDNRNGAAPPAADLAVDLTQCSHVGPMAVSALIALRHAFDHHGRTLRLLPPPPGSALFGYCGYSGLLHAFDLGLPPNSDHPDNVTVPGVVFNSLGRERAVMDLVERFVPLRDGEAEVLTSSLQELMMNTRDHSRSATGGVLSAKVFKRQGELRAVITDTGIGIRRSLSARVPVHTDLAALTRAIEEGVTSKSLERNYGQGLSNIRDIVAGNGGALVLASGTGVVRTGRGRKTQSQTLRAAFPGTIAMIKFRLAYDG